METAYCCICYIELKMNVAQTLKVLIPTDNAATQLDCVSVSRKGSVREVLMPIKLKAAYKTDVGRQREQNEDSPYMLISEEKERGLFIVADGMGGYRAGEVASQIAVQKISELLKHYLVPIAEQPTVKLSPVADMETIILDSSRPAEQTKQHKTRKLAESATYKSIEDQLKVAVRNANRAISSMAKRSPRRAAWDVR